VSQLQKYEELLKHANKIEKKCLGAGYGARKKP
jgi:hypothetical protein